MHDMKRNPHKRQRRQAAALVVQSFFNMGKKSTAQPRPAMHVPPRGIGPIAEPNENDVLCGRGGRINAHEGNVQFRDIVMVNKKEYLAKTTKKLEKAHIAARIVEFIRSMDPPGRFLKEDSDTGLWYDVGDAKAIKKAGQALREDAPDVRGESGEDDDDDDDQASPSVKKSSTEVSPKRGRSPTSSKKPVASTPFSASAAPTARTPTTGTAPAPAQRAPANGRPTQHNLAWHPSLSWHSSGSSTFGMPLPQEGPPMPSQRHQPQPMPVYSTGSGVSMPATTSVGSAQHSLYSGGANLDPSQLYQGMRNVSNRAVGTLSKRAAEIMQFQNLHAQAYRQSHPGVRYPTGEPDDVAFGRNFTPTELSSGSTMSTISDISNMGSNLTGSAMGGAAPSALSLGSSGMGPAPVRGNSQLGGWPAPAVVSQSTTSNMTSSGLSRSLSFGDCDVYSVVSTPMSDASFIALLSEDKAIEEMLSRMPPPTSSNSTARSSSSQFKTAFAPSCMSVASLGSNVSMMNVSTRSGASDNSWLRPNRSSSNKGQFEDMWPDDRSMMSEVSASILALDLALPP
jgi:hypothetical protein